MLNKIEIVRGGYVQVYWSVCVNKKEIVCVCVCVCEGEIEIDNKCACGHDSESVLE